jgi:peptidoglycan L-alanyl-D-glutamate endopeptidase CwlK
MRDKSLDHLVEPFRSKAFELIARCSESGFPVYVVETLRSEWQHQQDLLNHVSWTQHSKHQDGLAIDICIIDQYELHRSLKLAWNADDPTWNEVGSIGEKLGLVWGGRWKQRDMGHFEMPDDKKGENV